MVVISVWLIHCLPSDTDTHLLGTLSRLFGNFVKIVLCLILYVDAGIKKAPVEKQLPAPRKGRPLTNLPNVRSVNPIFKFHTIQF